MKKLLLSFFTIILVFWFISCSPFIEEFKPYEVTFDANGAEGQVPETVYVYEAGGSAFLPSCGELRKAGYGFAGWSKDSTGDGTCYTDKIENVSSDITLYAVWKDPLVYTLQEDTDTYIVECNYDYRYEKGLSSVVIPSSYNGKSVTDISGYAFYGCNSLTLIIISEGVTSIGESAFEGCTALKSITIPKSMNSIASDAFDDCYTLDSIVVTEGNEKYYVKDKCLIEKEAKNVIRGCKDSIISDDVISIGKSAFSGCSGLTSITIPDSVTSIGHYAFRDCSSLTDITIPDSVTSIGYQTFDGCSGLTSITIPSSVTSIGYCAFYGCSGLKSITIPNSLKKLGWNAFSGCSNLSIIFNGSKEEWDLIDKDNWDDGIDGYELSFTETRTLYSVYYNINGGEGKVDAVKKYDGETVVIATDSDLSREEYTFAGWNTAPDGSGTTYTVGQEITLKEDLTLYAVWTKVPVTVTYDINGWEESIDKVNSIYGATIKLDSGKNLSKTGYTFDGWSTAPNGTGTTYSAGQEITVTGNLTLYAKWKINTYTVKYCVNKGNGSIKDVSCDYGKTVTIDLGTKLTRTGYEFNGWNTQEDGNGEGSYKPGDEYKVEKDITLYAQWKPIEYTISYYLDGGELTEEYPTKYTIETETFTLVNPQERKGYEFKGWKLKNSEDTTAKTEYEIEKGTTGNISVVAVWRELESYSITYDSNGGEGFIADVTYVYGSTVALASGTNLTRAGYKFDCWNTQKDGKGKTYLDSSSIKVDKNIILYAMWVEEYLDFTYIEDSKSYSVECTNKKIVTAIIPASYQGKQVTVIGNNAFSDCKSLTSITIPSSVTSIEGSAFSGCSSLTSITIPSSVTSIGELAFCGCDALTNITIPASVTSIGDCAFFLCSSLTSITIPDSVTNIGEGVLSSCRNIGTIYVDSENPTYYSENNCIIAKASKKIIAGCKNSVIPEDVTSIGSSAFYGCRGLERITIPKGVTSIGNRAFNDCSCLTSITIPASVTSIGDYAFCFCGNLTSITIPSSVTSIGNYAFDSCSGLKSITIPNSLKKLGWNAFIGCSNLSIIFDGSKEEWNFIDKDNWDNGIDGYELSFTETRTLYSVSYNINGGEGSVQAVKKYDGETVVIATDSGLSRKEYTFAGWNTAPDGNGTTYTAGQEITVAGNLTLYAKWELIEYTISYYLDGGNLPEENPTKFTIETETFTLVNPEKEGFKFIGWIDSSSSEKSPKEIMTIKVGSIGEKSFTAVWKPYITITFDSNGGGNSAPSGKTVVAGDSVTVPSYGSLSKTGFVFSHWNTQENGKGISYVEGDSVEAEANVTLYAIWVEEYLNFTYIKNSDSYSVECTNENIVTVIIPASYQGKPVTVIRDAAFKDCRSLKSITIPDSVTSIEDWAFYDCSNLKSITIPDSVTSIGWSAFSNCSNLTSITIPNSVTSIESSAFLGCSSLTSITIPDGVMSIESSAFSGCGSLTSITIPSSVKSIGGYAFYGCSSLTSITIPNSVRSIGEYAFYYCSSLTSITISDSVTSIEDWAYYGCSSLTSVIIPDGVASIGWSAFSDCSNLSSIIIPSSVTSIEDWAFSGCSSLTSITIPDSVTSIGRLAFYCCSSLTSITIPDSVTNIGEGVLSSCRNIGTIYVDSENPTYYSENNCIIAKASKKIIAGCKNSVIPEDVTSIGSSAFYGCRGLERITIPKEVTSIEDSAFSGCSSLTSITIPNSVRSIGEYAFYYCSSLTSITIPNSVTSIEDYAFRCCSSLETITYTGTSENWKAITKGTGWNENIDTYTIYCQGDGVSLTK